MDFINKVGDALNELGHEAADKAKQLKEIADLKSQISACEEVIEKNYQEIGKLYYEKYGEMPGEAFAKQCRAIKNASRGVEELQQKLQEVKQK